MTTQAWYESAGLLPYQTTSKTTNTWEPTPFISLLSEEMGKVIKEIFWNFENFKAWQLLIRILLSWYFASHFHDFMTIFMSILDSPSNPTLNRHWRLITRPLCARRKHSTKQRGKKPCVILFVHKCTAVVIYSLNFAETWAASTWPNPLRLFGLPKAIHR